MNVATAGQHIELRDAAAGIGADTYTPRSISPRPSLFGRRAGLAVAPELGGLLTMKPFVILQGVGRAKQTFSQYLT